MNNDEYRWYQSRFPAYPLALGFLHPFEVLGKHQVCFFSRARPVGIPRLTKCCGLAKPRHPEVWRAKLSLGNAHLLELSSWWFPLDGVLKWTGWFSFSTFTSKVVWGFKKLDPRQYGCHRTVQCPAWRGGSSCQSRKLSKPQCDLVQAGLISKDGSYKCYSLPKLYNLRIYPFTLTVFPLLSKKK